MQANLARAWSSSAVFSRTYTMFGLLMVLIFIARAMFKYWQLNLLIALYLPLFVHIEGRLSHVMSQMAVSSSYFNRTPCDLLPWGFLLLLAGLAGVALCGTQLMPDVSVVSCYLFSLFKSVVIFMFSSAIKALLIGSGFVNFKTTRRGFFGVFQRVFIFARNIAITPIWTQYFAGVTDLMELWASFGEMGMSGIVYLLFKALIQLWLLWDFGFALSNYNENRSRMLRQAKPEEVKNQCVICQDEPYEPVAMPCGHVFCYSCAYRWLVQNNSCPLCRLPVSETKRIEFADGFMPLAAVFSAF